MLLLLRESVQGGKRLPEADHCGDQQDKGQTIAMSLREWKKSIDCLNRTPVKALRALVSPRYSTLFRKGSCDAEGIG